MAEPAERPIAARATSTPMNSDVVPIAEPYDSQSDLIEDVLASVYVRARTAAIQADLLGRGDPLGRAWPNELSAIERRIEARLTLTTSAMPLQMLRAS